MDSSLLLELYSMQHHLHIMKVALILTIEPCDLVRVFLFIFFRPNIMFPFEMVQQVHVFHLKLFAWASIADWALHVVMLRNAHAVLAFEVLYEIIEIA